MSSDSFDIWWTIVSKIISKQYQNNQHIVKNNIFKLSLNPKNHSVAKGSGTDLVQMHNKMGIKIDIAILGFWHVNSNTTAHKTKFGDGFIIYKKNRKQSGVVDAKQSGLIDVVSGVPQGTVLAISYSYFTLWLTISSFLK